MTPIENEDLRKVKVDETKYRSIIGNLLYLSICTKPNIIFSVSKEARRAKEPNMEDWNNVMRILRYLKGTKKYGINSQIIRMLKHMSIRITEVTWKLDVQQQDS